MATVHVVLSRVRSRSDLGSTLPLAESVEVGADTMTSSGTSAQSSLTAADLDVWLITVTGGNVWAKFGSDPTAASDTGWLLLDGSSRAFAASAASEKLAIKDV